MPQLIQVWVVAVELQEELVQLMAAMVVPVIFASFTKNLSIIAYKYKKTFSHIRKTHARN